MVTQDNFELNDSMECNSSFPDNMWSQLIVMMTIMTRMERDCDDNNINENDQKDHKRANKIAIDPLDILYILEILYFHALCKCGGPYSCGNLTDTGKIHKAIS